MNSGEPVREYFARKASVHDDVDQQPYWVFSDAILWGLLVDLVLPSDPATSFRLLDVGGGTARWSIRVLEAYPRAFACVVDFCPEMLFVARRKLDRPEFSGRAGVCLADVANMEALEDATFDIAFCFNNVLGFVPDVAQVLSEIRRLLRPGAVAALMFPSRYHAIYFSLSTGRLDEARRVTEQGQVCFSDDMPPLCVFTLGEIEEAVLSAGLSLKRIHGFPVTLYPGMEETTICGSTAHLRNLLSDETRRQWLYGVEFALCRDPKTASRGNNLLAIAQIGEAHRRHAWAPQASRESEPLRGSACQLMPDREDKTP